MLALLSRFETFRNASFFLFFKSLHTYTIVMLLLNGIYVLYATGLLFIKQLTMDRVHKRPFTSVVILNMYITHAPRRLQVCTSMHATKVHFKSSKTTYSRLNVAGWRYFIHEACLLIDNVLERYASRAKQQQQSQQQQPRRKKIRCQHRYSPVRQSRTH